VVSSTPRPHFTPGKDSVPIVQEAGWAPGPVWTGGKSRPHRDSIPDRPARSQSLYRLSYRAHHPTTKGIKNPLTGFIDALLKCRRVNKIAYVYATPHGGHARLYFGALRIA